MSILGRAFIFALGLLTAWGAEERIWLESKVNGVPAKIFFDTGAGAFYLFRSGAERLGFDLPEAGKSDWAMYWGDKCHLECPGFSGRIRPVITEPPSYVPIGDVDGFVGWKTVRENIIRFDAASNRVEFLSAVPDEAKAWTKFKVRTKGSGILTLEIPKEKSLIIIDSGSPLGIGLPQKKWDDWKAAHADRARTLAATVMPSVGLFAREQAWAGGLVLGELLITDIVVEEGDPWSKSIGKERLAATFGLGALKRIDLIVDGKREVAYMKPKTTSASPPNHNRLGAVFLPRADSGDAKIAIVVPNSPAAEAGIENGDILVNWRASDGGSGGAGVAAFWDRPAGARLQLKLQRGADIFEKQVVLRDLLRP